MSEECVHKSDKGEQEPWPSVQCVCGGTIYFKYTPREWVGLTEEEVHILWMDMGARPKINGYDFAKVIESKLKERNCG